MSSIKQTQSLTQESLMSTSDIMFVLSLLLNFLVTSTSAQVCTDEQCVFTFDVRWRKTMTYVDEATGENKMRCRSESHRQ